MEPSGSFDPLELKFTTRGAFPDVGVAEATATGGVFGGPAGSTSRVVLCDGALKLTVDPVKLKFERCVIAFDDVSWKTSATPVAAKLFKAIETGVVPDRYLLTTMIVSAVSEVRCAANTATLSGLGPPAPTLTSPNVEWFPS